MFKFCIVAAILASANAYYNHAPAPADHSYYGNYDGHVIAPGPISPAPIAPAPIAPAPIAPASVIPINAHHGGLYDHAYGNLGGASHTKIIEATYPGAVHKSANYANSAGYGAGYVHGASAITTGHSALPYNHGPVAVAPAIAYNHASIGNYGHSRYAVTEGPNYAYSRYSITGSHSPLAYGNLHRYPALPLADGVHKVAYNPVVAHMGYQSHAAHSYAW